MKNMFLQFFNTRDWLRIFIRFSVIMFWFHVTIAICIVVFQPLREAFIEWIVLNNSEYFTIVYKDTPMLDNNLNIEMI